MPIVAGSTYQPPIWLRGGHCQTIFPSLFRRVNEPHAQRTRIPTPDADFLDIDRAFCGRPTTRLGILSHGLEGHSRRQYITGMSRALLRQGWDSMAWNCRFCGGEPNLQPRLYHTGETGDLKTVIQYALEQGYSQIVLIGFSMGGNQILKYLGEDAPNLPPEVAGAVVFSVPCDLAASSLILGSTANRVYMANFMHSLRAKMRVKHQRHPKIFDISDLDKVRDFKDFDERFTAPIFGFASAEDYWQKASSLQFLASIKTPALLITARNDPFMSPSCYPEKIALDSPFLYLEMPKEGGHTGFTPATGSVKPHGKGLYWSESRAVEFTREVIGMR